MTGGKMCKKRFKAVCLLGTVFCNTIGAGLAMESNPNLINNSYTNSITCNKSLDKIAKCFENKPYGLKAELTDNGTFLTITNDENDALLKFHKSGKIPNDDELYEWAGCSKLLSEIDPDCNAESCVSLDASSIDNIMKKVGNSMYQKVVTDLNTNSGSVNADVNFKTKFEELYSNELNDSPLFTTLCDVYKYKKNLEELAENIDLEDVNENIKNPSDIDTMVYDVALKFLEKSQNLSEFAQSMDELNSGGALPTQLELTNADSNARFRSIDCDFEIVNQSKHKRDVINAYLVLLGILKNTFSSSPFVHFDKCADKFSEIKSQLTTSLIYSPIKEAFYMLFLGRSNICASGNCVNFKPMQLKFNSQKQFGYDGNETLHLSYSKSQKYLILPFDRLSVHCALFEELKIAIKKGTRFGEQNLEEINQHILRYDILLDFEQPLTIKHGKQFVFRPRILIDDKTGYVRSKTISTEEL